MKFSFFLSSLGGSPVQVGMERGLRQLGHDVSYFSTGQIKDFDVLVVFNQTAHNSNYVYPEFPVYNVSVVFMDNAEYGPFRYLPENVKSYQNAFTEGSMAHETKNRHEQTRLLSFLNSKSFPYMLTGYSKHLQYPNEYHPISYPLYAYSLHGSPPDLGDYLRRALPFWLSWGASHPWRWAITSSLRNAGYEVFVLGENDFQRIEQGKYFTRIVESRASAGFDGYGPFSFRTTEVLVRTVLLLGPVEVVSQAPLVDGVNCVSYSLDTNGEECTSTDIVTKLKWTLDSPEEAFKIYEAGYYHCLDKMSEAATAQYLVDTIENHDWSKPTQLEL